MVIFDALAMENRVRVTSEANFGKKTGLLALELI